MTSPRDRAARPAPSQPSRASATRRTSSRRSPLPTSAYAVAPVSTLALSVALALAAGPTLVGCSSGEREASSGSTQVGAGSTSTGSTATGGTSTGGGATTTPSTPQAPTGGPITTFATGLTPTRELFVATTGNDTTGDGSQGNPYATIERAAQAIAPGTAIRVQPGTYNGGIFVSNLSGTPAAPIWISGVPGAARPVIQGGNTGMQLSQVRYLVLHDLEVTGAAQNGLNCDDGGRYSDPEATRFVVFERLYVHDMGSGGNNDGLKLSGVDDYWVLDCAFARVSAGSGIDQVGCHDGLIARTTFEQMGSNSIQLKGGSRDVEVRWCTFTDGGQRGINIGGSTGDAYFRPPLSTTAANVEATRIRVLGNTFIRGTTPFAFVGATDSIAAHNTVIDPERWLLRILQERTTGGGYTFVEASNCEVVNNVFHFRRASVGTEVNVGPNTQPATFTFQTNLYFAADDPSRSQPNLPVQEQGTVLGDPQLTSLATGDLTPQPTSPARNAGTPPAPLTTDANGNAFAPAPTVGAYEVP
jgi:hypothetical protein